MCLCVCICIHTHTYIHECVLSRFSCVWLFVTSWTIAHQASLSMGFSRQEFWTGLPFHSPGNLPTQGSNPCLLHCKQVLYYWITGEALYLATERQMYACLYLNAFKIIISILKFFIFVLLIIYLAVLSLSCSAWNLRSLLKHAGFFLVTACRIFSCGMQTLSCSMWNHSSLNKDWTQAPCIGSVKS